MQYYFYILYSSSADKYYCGSSSDLDKRLAQHNAGRNKSTKHGIPWQIVYTESFVSRPEAYNREMEVKKKKSRKYITWLISAAG